jgi:hypothetical protein
MKRLFIILCILFFAAPCLANQIIIGKKKTAGCTLIASPKTTGDNQLATLGYTSIQYLHSAFQAEADETIRTVVLKMGTDNNSPSADVVVALCTSNAGAPDVCTNADAIMDTPGTAGYKYLRWSAGYAITNTNYYHIRIYTSQNSSSNYYNLAWNNAVTGYVIGKSADGSSWENYGGDSSARIFFELSECVTYVH